MPRTQKLVLTNEEISDRELAKREKARWYNIKRLYGISQQEYEELLDRQNHCCAICKRHESEFSTRLHVDHAHAGINKGYVRGLLCMFCNSRFLGRHHNAELFRAAADYLEQPHTGWLVPTRKRSKKRKKKVKK
jgi:hypothetical protein